MPEQEAIRLSICSCCICYYGWAVQGSVKICRGVEHFLLRRIMPLGPSTLLLSYTFNIVLNCLYTFTSKSQIIWYNLIFAMADSFYNFIFQLPHLHLIIWFISWWTRFISCQKISLNASFRFYFSHRSRSSRDFQQRAFFWFYGRRLYAKILKLLGIIIK